MTTRGRSPKPTLAMPNDLFEAGKFVQGTLAYVAPDRIDPNPMQPRHAIAEEGLVELQKSIAARGILEPLLGERAAGGRVVLIAGHRRLAAAKRLGLARVPVVLLERPNTAEFTDSQRLTRWNAADALVDALVENVQREGLTEIEEGEAFRVLSDEFNYSSDEIGRKIGKTGAFVRQRIAAANKLTPEAREILTVGLAELGVTRVTDSEESNNQRGGGRKIGIGLMRAMSALSSDRQKTAADSLIAESRRLGRLVTTREAGAILKHYRVGTHHEARQLTFDFDDLEVVRWSAQERPDVQIADRQKLNDLIRKYEADLATLRHHVQNLDTA